MEGGAVEQRDTTKPVLNSLIESISIKRVFLVYFIIVSFYVYLPMISVVAFSFNSGGLTFPFVDFTFDWYYEMIANDQLVTSVWRSLILASVVTVITTILATAMALAYRYDFRGKRALLFLLILGIITPGITYGVGATLFLNELMGLSKGLWLATPVHVVWALPFAVIVLLAGFPPSLAENEEAAKVMGADRFTIFRRIILPQIAPTVLGAAVFAFTLSYNEATRGLLLVGTENTMPLQIFAISAGTRVSPALFALGGVTTVFSTILLVLAGFLVFYRS